MHVLECIHRDERLAGVTLSILHSSHRASCSSVLTNQDTHTTFHVLGWTGVSFCPLMVCGCAALLGKGNCKALCILYPFFQNQPSLCEQPARQNLVYSTQTTQNSLPSPTHIRKPWPSMALSPFCQCSFLESRTIDIDHCRQKTPCKSHWFHRCSNPAASHPRMALIKLT